MDLVSENEDLRRRLARAEDALRGRAAADAASGAVVERSDALTHDGDAGERRCAEEELARSHRLLRTTIDTSLQIIQLFKAVRDRRGAIVDFEWLLTNKKWNDRYGSNVGKRLLAENPAVVESGVWDKFLAVMETGIPITHEHHYAHEQFDGWFLQTIAKADDGILLSTLDITDRKRAEIALRDSEAGYRMLLEGIDEGFCLCERVDGEPLDYRYLAANPAFQRQSGFGDPVGRTMRELLPEIESPELERYRLAEERRQPQRFESHVAALDRWFEVEALPADGPRRIAILFRDISQRKLAEAVLRENEEKQSLLLSFSDALRAEQGPDAIADRAIRMLSDRLGLDRCYLATYRLSDDRADITHQVGNDRVAPMPDTITLSHFPAASQVVFDATLVIGDVLADEGLSPKDRTNISALGLRALLAVTLRRGPDRPAWAIVTVSAVPRHWTRSEIALVEEVAERIWAAIERARAETRLRGSEERLRLALEVGRVAAWDWDLSTNEVQWSDEHYRMMGYAVGEVAPSYEAWAARVHPDDLAETEAALRAARDGDEDYTSEYRCVRPDGEVRWLCSHGRFFRNEAGEAERMVGAAIDVTDRREWAERQKVLLAELQHRVRNILAIVRSVVVRSEDGERSAMDYAQHLQGRLSALARTQVLLTRHPGAGVDLEDMIRDELLAQIASDSQFTLVGPDVELSAKAAEVLTLALHELATNATKYGAFSRASGRLIVEWTVEPRDHERWLLLTWTERGVPIVDAVPRRQGFGSELISRRIPYELKGSGSFVLKPGGLESRIEFPLRAGDSVLQTGGAAW